MAEGRRGKASVDGRRRLGKGGVRRNTAAGDECRGRNWTGGGKGG